MAASCPTLVDPPTVSVVIELIRTRQASPFALHSCIPSLASKRALMSAAAAEADPDIALALVCALADTLVVPVFMQLLQPHEHLIGMYRSYLRRRGDTASLSQINKALNDVQREGIGRVARAAAVGSDEADVMKAQRWCARMSQHKDTPKDCRGELAELAQFMTNVSQLRSRCRAIEDFDAAREGVDPLFKKMRRPCLIGASVTKLLSYSCLYARHPHFLNATPVSFLCMYHPNVVDETKLSCSKVIFSVYECSRQNFMWQRMLSRARLKDWAALKDLAIDRGIFLTTTESCIGFGPFVEACIENSAPKEVTVYFLKLVAEPELRYRYATRVAEWEVALKCISDIDGWRLFSSTYVNEHRIFQAWVTDAASVLLEASQEDGKQSVEVKQRLQLLLDAKMTIDEALQIRKPPTSLMRQPFAPAEAAEVLVASAALGLLD